jgi:acyl-CoA thioester hydrolase
MENIFFEGPVLWSMIDANMHLRHSAYADFAAQARIAMLEKNGFTPKQMLESRIGPILFREELVYMKEIGLSDYVYVSCVMTRSRPDGSRWAFTQDIFRKDGNKAAVVNTEGAWIDMEKRKLTALPPGLMTSFGQIPRSSDFTEEVPKQKG